MTTHTCAQDGKKLPAETSVPLSLPGASLLSINHQQQQQQHNEQSINGRNNSGRRSKAIASLVWIPKSNHPECGKRRLQPQDNEFFTSAEYNDNMSTDTASSLSWSLQCRYYFDRADWFLPQSPNTHIDTSSLFHDEEEDNGVVNGDVVGGGTTNEEGRGGGAISSSAAAAAAATVNGGGSSGSGSMMGCIPTCCTSLSALCVVNESGDVFVYLHGRFMIVSIAGEERQQHQRLQQQRAQGFCFPKEIVCSYDLSSIGVLFPSHSNNTKNTDSLLSQQKQRRDMLTLYTIPYMSHQHQQQHHLTRLSASYGFLSSQLAHAEYGVYEALKGWKESIKPLERKFEALRVLLKSYGCLVEEEDENNEKKMKDNEKSDYPQEVKEEEVGGEEKKKDDDHHNEYCVPSSFVTPRSEFLHMILVGAVETSSRHRKAPAIRKIIIITKTFPRFVNDAAISSSASGKPFSTNNNNNNSSAARNDAMIQFFATRAGGNEILLQRMMQSVQSGVASKVEAKVRTTLLSAAQALVYAVNELHGYAKTEEALNH